MKAGVLLAALLIPLALHAQEEPPAGLADVELARSRACVPAMSHMEDLNRTLQPYAARLERVRALGRAVSLEDRAEADPIDAADELEKAVADWFAQDSTLAARWVAERTDALQHERAQARTAILERLRGAIQALQEEARAQLGDAPAAEAAVAPCDGAILVRSAVVEACGPSTATVCQAAAAAEPQEGFRFVDAPADLWDVQEYRPWSQPGPMQATPQGALVGARTGSQGRRANAVLALSLAPMLRNRSDLGETEIAEFEANLDSLGFTFDHPAFVMAPALEIAASVPPPMDGETHVIVHFGDLTGDDVIWSSEIGDGGLLQAVFPAQASDLARLQGGEVVSMTAVRVPEAAEGETPEADAIYTVGLLTVNQAAAVTGLLQYMGGGGLSNDLKAIIPPSGGGTPGR